MAEAWFCSYFKPASFVLAVDFSCSNICQGKASVYSSLLIYQRAMADVDTLAWEFFEEHPPQTSSGHNDDEAHTRKQTKENHTRFTHIPNHAFIMPIAPKCHGVLNQQRLDCLFNSLFGWQQRNHESSTLLTPCEGNPPMTCGFPSQRVSNAENIS